MKNNALKISVLSLSSALVAVFTLIVRIPTPTTGGYISLTDTAIAFTALAFGPFTGFVAGGLGTAFADLIGGYPQWAAISFIVHGLEGLAIGLIVRGTEDKLWRKITGIAIGAVIVPMGYFLLTWAFLDSAAVASVEIIPNLIQGGLGCSIGLILYVTVSKGYRNLNSLRVVFRKKEDNQNKKTA